MNNCEECSEYIKHRHDKHKSFCFDCGFWKECLVLLDDPNSVRARGKQFYIGSETDSDKGYGGARFVITFKDGRVVSTTNLNMCGKIPQRWLERLPDNADF